MTIDDVMEAARDFRHAKFGDDFDFTVLALRAAILAYGAAQRERCAVVCDGLTFAIDHGGSKYRRPAHSDACAAHIRKLGDE